MMLKYCIGYYIRRRVLGNGAWRTKKGCFLRFHSVSERGGVEFRKGQCSVQDIWFVHVLGVGMMLGLVYLQNLIFIRLVSFFLCVGGRRLDVDVEHPHHLLLSALLS